MVWGSPQTVNQNGFLLFWKLPEILCTENKIFQSPAKDETLITIRTPPRSPGRQAVIVPRAWSLHGEGVPGEEPHRGCLNAGREPPGESSVGGWGHRGLGMAPCTPTLTVRRSTRAAVEAVQDAHSAASPRGCRHLAQLTCVLFCRGAPIKRGWGLSPRHVALATTLWEQAWPLTWAH